MDISSEELKKRFEFYSAILDIVKIFGETEIGTCEVNEEALSEYCSSDKFAVDNFNIKTKEDIYQKITDDILCGFPVWQFLDISDWTKEMVSRSFIQEEIKLKEELKRKYKCYTCKYYIGKQTSYGYVEKCNYDDSIKNIDKRDFTFWRARRDEFEPKKSCKYYTKEDKQNESNQSCKRKDK